MRFMILRKADSDTEAGNMPSEELLSAMADYNGEMVKAGIMVTGEGLKPSAKGARIKFRQGKPIVTDGPFAETKELLAGYTLIDVESKEEAIEWTKRWPALDANGEVELELRQAYELADFGQADGLAKHEKLSEQLSRQPSSMTPYLLFNGQCRDALALYADCFGGTIEGMLTHGDSPIAGEVPTEHRDLILHACLKFGKHMLMASDSPAELYEKPQGTFVQVTIDDAVQAERAFNKLAEGGKVRMPFEQTFWAHRFGMLADRFGILWMINCNLVSCDTE